MLKSVILIKYHVGETGPGLKKILKDVFVDMIKFWHTRILPKHFTIAGASEYGYEPRTKKYQIRKAKAHGHQNPLVYSGRSMREVLQAVRITSTSKGGKGGIEVPTYYWKSGMRGPNKVKELLTTSSEDENTLAFQLNKKIESGIKSSPVRKKKLKT